MKRTVKHDGSIVRNIVNPIVNDPTAADVVNSNVSEPDFKTQKDSEIDNKTASSLTDDNEQQNISGRMIEQKVDQRIGSKHVVVDDLQQKLVFDSSPSDCSPNKKTCFNSEEDEEIVVETVITAGESNYSAVIAEQIKPASFSPNKLSVPIISTPAAVKRKSPFSSNAVAGTKSTRIVPVKSVGSVVAEKAAALSKSSEQQAKRIITQKAQSTKTVPIAANKSFPAINRNIVHGGPIVRKAAAVNPIVIKKHPAAAEIQNNKSGGDRGIVLKSIGNCEPIVRKAAAVNPVVIKKQPTAAAIQNDKSGVDRGIVLKPIGNLMINKRDRPIVKKSPATTGFLRGGNLVVNKSQSASNISLIVRKSRGIVSSRRNENGSGGDPIVKNKPFVVQGKPVVQSISNRVMKPLGSSSAFNEASSKPLVVVAKQQFGTIKNKPFAARPVIKGGCIVGSHRMDKSAASGVIKPTFSVFKLSSHPIADARRKPSKISPRIQQQPSTPDVITID